MGANIDNCIVRVSLQDNTEFLVKLQRAYGGCLGAGGRRRTRSAAKRFGELQTSCDPEISEWGNPARVMSGHAGRVYPDLRGHPAN